MYKIEVHDRINQIISLLLVSGLWQDENCSGLRKLFVNVMNFSACVYYPIGLIGGLLITDNKMEYVIMSVSTIAVLVQLVRIYYFLRKKDQIFELVRSLGTHIVRKEECTQVYLEVNSKIKRFMDFASLFILLVFLQIPVVTISALVANGKHLPMNLYFPLNWKESEVVYWFALTFCVYTIAWHVRFALLNVIIWYMMMSSAIKYEILGNELKHMGAALSRETFMIKQKKFGEELIESIQIHRHLKDTTDACKMIFSNLFFIQLTTSGLNICGVVFNLAFVQIENPFEFVFSVAAAVYISFEIFMLTYFGNEIKLWSSRLSYCLFECNWLDQSKSCKGCMITLMEVLKQPQVLVIGKLYPLDLQIFTKILNFAYSMFNVLMSIK